MRSGEERVYERLWPGGRRGVAGSDGKDFLIFLLADSLLDKSLLFSISLDLIRV
jgi:hypothetical protein